MNTKKSTTKIKEKTVPTLTESHPLTEIRTPIEFKSFNKTLSEARHCRQIWVILS